MKTKLLLGICVVVALLSTAFAQAPMPDTIKVSFSFPVVLNKVTLPSGSYDFRRVTDNLPADFEVYDSNGKLQGITTVALKGPVGSDPAYDATKKDEVVVDEIGGKYYLNALYLQGAENAYYFVQSSEMEKQIEQAAKGGKGQHVPISTSKKQ